jgi:hypothetical protein
MLTQLPKMSYVKCHHMFIGTDSENAKRSNMFIGTYPNGQQAQLETIKYEKNGILYILCMYVYIPQL